MLKRPPSEANLRERLALPIRQQLHELRYARPGSVPRNPRCFPRRSS